MTIKSLYDDYLAPDKMLRHTFQHLEVAILGFVILWLISDLDINFKNIFIFLIATYLPDIDGITSVFIWQSSNEMAKKTVKLLNQLKIKEALSYATIHHKKLNRLIFHNLIAYPIFWIIFIFSLKNSMTVESIFLAGFIAHFTFDILDDVYQLGHIKNWLWFLKLT